jgi:hypothetical protein
MIEWPTRFSPKAKAGGTHSSGFRIGTPKAELFANRA